MKRAKKVFAEEQAAHSPWLAKIFPPAVLVFLTGLFYYPSMNYPFQFDDIANIAKKFAIRFDNPLERFWYHTRWLSDWLNSLNYQWGNFDPFWYRIFNLSIHMVAGVALFFLVLSLCRMATKRPFMVDNAISIAFATAGLFLLHPVQTQTVTYVIQARQEGLASMFVIITLLAYVRAVVAQSWWSRGGAATLFFVFALLARGTKELVIVLPFLLVLVEWFFVAQEEWSAFRKRLGIGLVIASLLFIAILYQLSFKYAWDVFSFNTATVNNRGNILSSHAFDPITPWGFFISQFRVLVHYIAIFFWPFDISVEYGWKLVTGFWTPQVMVPGVLLLALVGYLFRSMFRKENLPATFGFLWFFIVMAPRATIIPSSELVCDYKTYLASAGLVFFMGYGLVYVLIKACELIKEKLATTVMFETRVGALAVVMLLVGASAYQRNKVWETTIGFWEDNVLSAPSKPRAHNNLGVALSEAGRYDEAIVCYQRAIALDSHYADPLSNLAVAYSMKNDPDKAIEALRAAIHISPMYPEAYNNLGTLLVQKGRHEEAEEALRAAIKLRPYYGKAFYNLARMYEEKGDSQKAWESLKSALEGDLDVPEVYFRFGQMSLKIGKYDSAVKAFEWVVAHGETSNQAYFNLANAYFMDGKHERAQGVYERLVKLDPNDARYAHNLAETHYMKKDFASARYWFEKITKMPQPLPQAFFRVAHCLERMKKYDEAKNYLDGLTALNAADDFKKAIQTELTRLALQQKVDEGKGSIGLKDFKTALAQGKTAVK